MALNRDFLVLHDSNCCASETPQTDHTTPTKDSTVDFPVDSSTDLIPVIDSPTNEPPTSFRGIFQQCSVRTVKGLFMCQVTAMLICGTGVFSNLLVTKNVNIPTLQSFGNYLCLSLVYTTSYVYTTSPSDLKRNLKAKWWKYLILAAFDVEGNYLMVKAYQYTTMTSVQLLDSITIPVVLVLSWFALKYRYKLVHFGGVLVALVGMGIMMYADVEREPAHDDDGSTASPTNATLVTIRPDASRGSIQSTTYQVAPSSPPSKLLGDVFAIVGAAFYGFSNVGQEYFVKNAGQLEFLALVGFFGAVINGVQFCVLERSQVGDALSKPCHVYLYILGFNACLFTMYSIVPKTLQLTSAAVFNISILTADFYTFLFGLFLFHLPISYFYFIAYIFVIVGITIYSVRPVPSPTS